MSSFTGAFSGLQCMSRIFIGSQHLRSLLLLERLPWGYADPKFFRTQISLLSSIPTISCSSKSTLATFLLHLILFRLSRLHSWQYIARMVQGRSVRLTEGYVYFWDISLGFLTSLRTARQVLRGMGPQYLLELSHRSIFCPKRNADSKGLIARNEGRDW